MCAEGEAGGGQNGGKVQGGRVALSVCPFCILIRLQEMYMTLQFETLCSKTVREGCVVPVHRDALWSVGSNKKFKGKTFFPF